MLRLATANVLATGLVTVHALVCTRSSSSISGATRQRITRSTEVSITDCGVCDSWSPFSENCKPCDDGSVRVNGQLVTPKALREVEVMDADGDTQQLLSVLGNEKSVLVLLRHLG